ncbi:MAG: geranylgeranyl reductase family protein [Thermodesulfovibrionales bacterium]|nr:geranylgeranyl reductase family protein [Thermodesulfovibrionales bacterium]
MKPIRTKALVIGGGPSGSTAARHLAGSGIDTILIEKNPSFVKPCGGVMPSSAFNELDLPRHLIKREVRKIRVVSPKGKEAELELEGGFMAMVERGGFDSCLREEAKKAGAEVIEAEFKGFAETGDEVVSEVVINGFLRTITSDYVIAADGAGSKSLASLGLKPPASIFTLSKILPGEQDACEFWFGQSHAPKFYSWVFPAAGGISIGTGSVRPENLRGLLENFLSRRGYEPGHQGSVAAPLRGWRMPLWGGGLFNRGRILFAGDAAGQVMPFTFEGIYYAMKAGSFAAEAVASGRPDAYKKFWRKRFYARFLFMKKLWSLFGNSEGLIEKFISMHRNPSVKEASMRLWLNKEMDGKALLSYMNIFREFLS